MTDQARAVEELFPVGTPHPNYYNLSRLYLIHGPRKTGKSLALKAMLHRTKEGFAKAGIMMPIVTNEPCCFSDLSLAESYGAYTRSKMPRNAIVGLDNILDKFRYPETTIYNLKKRNNVVFAAIQSVEDLNTRFVHSLVDFFAKPRLYLDRDILCLDMIRIHNNRLMTCHPKQWIKQGTGFGDISSLFCDCQQEQLVRARPDATG